MKKLFLIVAAIFVAVSFSACSDDDDNGHASDKPVLVKQYIVTEVGDIQKHTTLSMTAKIA